MSNDYFDSADYTAPSRKSLARASSVADLATALQTGFALLPGKALLNEGRVTYATAVGGTANAITVTLNTTLSAYTAGLGVEFKATADNTSSVTLNVDTVGAVAVKDPSGNALTGGEIQQNAVVTVRYNGTDFILTSGYVSADQQTLAAIASDITTVSGISTNVTSVANIAANVTTVAGIAANVTTVAGISGNVTTVAGISADVSTVAADGTDIGTVAGSIANVNIVAASDTNIGTVAGIDTEIGIVSGISANVTTVANVSANVTTVAGISAAVSTVAGISSNITTVAGISADVTTVADNIAAVQDAASLVNAAWVVGPASATDNALPRFDGTTGKLVQDSGWTLDDSDVLNGGDNDATRANFIDTSAGVHTISGTSGAITIDHENGHVQTLTATGSCTFTFSNWPTSGARGWVAIVLTNGSNLGATDLDGTNWYLTDGTTSTTFADLGITLGTRNELLIYTDNASTRYGYVS